MNQNNGLVFWVYHMLNTKYSWEPHVSLTFSVALIITLTLLLVVGAIKLNRVLFRKIIRADSLYLKYGESLLDFLFIICGLLLLGIFLGNAKALSRILLGSTGLIVVIIGIAAQSALGDVIAGLMIGLCRPFRLGDRITLESSGISGTVRDMTIRHTVIHRFDGLYVVVPNSVINTEVIHNNSYQNELTGSYLEFSISYDSDIETAMRIIHDAVVNCIYTVEYVGDNPEFKRAAVYVTDFAASSINLRTTVWTRNSDDNFLACSQIRVRVKKEFDRCGIEIPYQYVNVVAKTNKDDAGAEKDEAAQTRPRRHSIQNMVKEVRDFCREYNVSRKESMHLNILSEELLELMQSYSATDISFDIRMNGTVCEMRLTSKADLDRHAEAELMSISSTGKNIAGKGLITTIRNVFEGYRNGSIRTEKWSLQNYQSNLRSGDVNAEEISRSIIVKLADDVQIGIRNGMVEMTVYKKLWSVSS